SSQSASVASSGLLSGNTFCAHLFVGMEITVQGNLSFIIYFLNLFRATPAALLALAILLGSTSFNKSGSVALMEMNAASSSAKDSCSFTLHSGYVSITSTAACVYLSLVNSSSCQS